MLGNAPLGAGPLGSVSAPGPAVNLELPSRRDLPPLPPFSLDTEGAGLDEGAFSSVPAGSRSEEERPFRGPMPHEPANAPSQSGSGPIPFSQTAPATPINRGVAAIGRVAGEVHAELNQTMENITSSATIEIGKSGARASIGGSRTAIGRAVLTNHVPIALAAMGLLDLIELKLSNLSDDHGRLNSDDGRAAVKQQIVEYSDLKERIIAFLAANKEFVAGNADETEVIESTTSLAQGVRNWWHRDHVSICHKIFERASFGAALGICYLAGAGGPLSVVTAGSLVVGKQFTDVLSAYAKVFSEKS